MAGSSGRLKVIFPICVSSRPGSESVIIVIHTNESFFSGAPRQERHPVRCGGALPQTRLLFPAFPALLYALFAAILCVMYWLRTFTGLLSSHPHA